MRKAIGLMLFSVMLAAHAQEQHERLNEDHLPAGLDLAEFEMVLETQFEASNALYVALDPKRRLEVYKAYQKDDSLSALRRNLLKQYLVERKSGRSKRVSELAAR